MLPTFCPPTIWTISLEFYRKPSILAADDFLGACYRKAMTPKKLWTLLFLHKLRILYSGRKPKIGKRGSLRRLFYRNNLVRPKNSLKNKNSLARLFLGLFGRVFKITSEIINHFYAKSSLKRFLGVSESKNPHSPHPRKGRFESKEPHFPCGAL